ncbi:hypothetical protein DNTS_023710 [Danionella cerebrum]|uniref:Uncharacterized protein n=1 Tax=Danionella cerebrum TaxID=2873325 RepID=A0A553MMQ0_9TELE|nr:hypothetical protein DNTS_023710 [Danionella translucida]
MGIYLMTSSLQFSSLLPSLRAMNIANTLFISGIIITCLSFLGFLGALKENRCLLISFFILLLILMLAKLAAACFLLIKETEFQCCGVDNATDWGKNIPNSCNRTESGQKYWPKGCYIVLKDWFEENLLSTGVGVITVCIIEVLGMCFSMTLFCHISRSGLGYK